MAQSGAQSAITVTGAASDDLSGVASVTCNGTLATLTGSAFSCNISLTSGVNTVVAQATDNAGNISSATVNVTYGSALNPPPTSLSLTPDHFAMAMSETRKLALVDDLARAIAATNWVVNDPTVAQVAADGTITPISAGSTTITASYRGLSATSYLTVYGTQTLPGGTVRWSVQPLPGDTLTSVYPGQPTTQDDPDVYFMESAGSKIVVRALTSDGRQKWAHTILPTSGSGGVGLRDAQSTPAPKLISAAQAAPGMVRPHRWGKKITAFLNEQAKERQTALMASRFRRPQIMPASFRFSTGSAKLRLVRGQSNAVVRPVQLGGDSVATTVLSSAVTDAGNQVVNTFESDNSRGCLADVDNIVVLDANGNELWRHSVTCGEMGFALHPDGIVYILQADYNNNSTFTLFAMDELTGATKFAIQLPFSWGGSLQPFVGLPSVFPDGNLYLPVETAANPSSPDVLQLLKVAPDGTYNWYPVSTASQCYGPSIEPHEAIPDGKGGALVTWDFFFSYTFCNGNQGSVQMDRLNGTDQVLGQYQLPLAGRSLQSYFSDNDGDAVLGQEHLFVTDGKRGVAGFNLGTSSVDLNWQSPNQCLAYTCTSIQGVSKNEQVIASQKNPDGSSTLFAVAPNSNSCPAGCTTASSVPNATLVAFDFNAAVFSPALQFSIPSSQYLFTFPAPSALGTQLLAGVVTAPNLDVVAALFPPWPTIAVHGTRESLTEEVTVIGWIDKTQVAFPPPNSVSSALSGALKYGCVGTLTAFFFGNRSLISSDFDRQYANAFLIYNSANNPPPQILDPNRYAEDGDFRLFNRAHPAIHSSGDQIESALFPVSTVALGNTVDSCKSSLTPKSFLTPEAHPDNAAKGITSSKLYAFQLNEGRVGSKGQNINMTLNACTSTDTFGLCNAPAAPTVPWIYSVILYDVNGKYSVDHQIFPTYSIYEDRKLIQTIHQSALESFIKLNSSSQIQPGDLP